MTTTTTVYEMVSQTLTDSDLDYTVVDTPDGIALIGEDASDVFLVTVRLASLEVSPT